MIDDIVEVRGYLTLGSRLKRIGEKMQADVTRMFKDQGIDVPGALWPTLGALERHGELNIGELAASLGIAQPGVTRNVAQLEKLGLVTRGTKARDQRLKTVALSDEGARLVEQTKATMWPKIERAVAEICDGLDGPLLEQLTQIEDALAQKPLDQRVKMESET